MSFTSPMKGRYTSAFNLSRYITINGRRVFSPHAGMDIAPPTPGQVGTPVYAASSGTVVRTIRGRKHGQSSSVGAVLASGRSGNGALIAVGSGRHLYGHVRLLSSVSVGDKVVTGQLLGYTDTSGIQSGPHLHFEAWRTSSASSYYNPATLFAKAGISVGSTPRKATSQGSSTSKGNNGYTSAEAKKIQTALKKMGYYSGSVDGVYGNLTKSAVKKYQKKANLYVDGMWGSKTQAYYDKHEGKTSSSSSSSSSKDDDWVIRKESALARVKKSGHTSVTSYQRGQKCPLGLRITGVWDTATEKHYQETLDIQKAMNKWAGGDLVVDGDYGSKTAARVREIKSRNKGGAWKGTITSEPNAAFLNMIGLSSGGHNHK